MRLQELVLCATAPQSQESGPGSVVLHDIQNTTILASFKQTSASSRCTAVLESSSTQGGFILASQPDKSVLNVYNFQKVSFRAVKSAHQQTVLALGPNCPQMCPPRKVDMHSHR